jgi:TRAP-type C4-dicarboxylate transport system permease small subunit
MKFINKFGEYISFVTHVISIISYAGYAIMVLITVLDVALRYIMNSPILGSYEIVQYILLISLFASFPYCETLHGHIKVTMFLRLLPLRTIFIINTLTGLLSTAVWVFLGYAASQQALYAAAKGYVSGVLKFPIAPFMWVESICVFVFALSTLSGVFYSAAAIFDKDLQKKLIADLL